MEFDLITYLLLFFAGAGAGFIDSIAGGGGIITLPVLLAAGIPPHQALATNKLQSTFGSFTAVTNYTRLGMVSPKDLIEGVLFTLIGAGVGAYTVQQFSAGFLENLIIVMLVVIFLYTAFSPKLGYKSSTHKIPHKVYYALFGLLIGFYDGFFGPGTGSFWTMSMIVFLGLDLKAATAQTKLFNFTSNIVSFAVFAYAGLMLWRVGVLMGAGQMIGAYIGSTLVHRRDVGFVRVFFLIVVAATIIRLIVAG
jgi:uncharacterized membrane protein YfcA